MVPLPAIVRSEKLIGAGIEADGVKPVLEVQDRVAAAAVGEDECVEARTARQDIVVAAAGDGVVACTGDDRVDPRTAVDDIAAAARIDGVVTLVALDRVCTGAAVERVVAAAPLESIFATEVVKVLSARSPLITLLPLAAQDGLDRDEQVTRGRAVEPAGFQIDVNGAISAIVGAVEA